MPKKVDPNVVAHIHKDLDVTPERVRAFGKAKYVVRLAVLAKLRAQSSNQASSLELAAAGLLLGFLALVVAPSKGVDFHSMPILVTLAVGAVLGIAGGIALAPVWVPQMIRQGRQERAQIWLAAYEDEIARRAAKGK